MLAFDSGLLDRLLTRRNPRYNVKRSAHVTARAERQARRTGEGAHRPATERRENDPGPLG